MARTLDTDQQARSLASRVAPLWMVMLTTYTDRGAETEDTVFYLSTRDITYDYANEGTDRTFLPWLLSVGEVDSGINHLAGPEAAGLIEQPFTVRLSNREWLGERIIDRLREQHTLTAAKIEIGQYLTTPSEASGKGLLDLSALTGDEHTVWRRGRIRRLAVHEEEIELQCETIAPSWSDTFFAADATAVTPRDLGVRYPVPFGDTKFVPLVTYNAAQTTTLVADIDDSTTSMEFSDASLFPSGNGSARIDAEEISWTSISNNVPAGVTRGTSGTSGAAHIAGAVVITIPDEVYWLASVYPSESIETLYMLSPSSGQLERITAGYTLGRYDDTLVSGRIVSSVMMTNAQLRALLGSSTNPLELYADVKGAIAPIDWETYIYGFESATNWENTTQCDAVLDTGVYSQGSGSIKMLIDDTMDDVSEACDVGSWDEQQCGTDYDTDEYCAAHSSDTSIRGTPTGAAACGFVLSHAISEVDLTGGLDSEGKLVIIRCMIQKDGAEGGTVRFRIGHNSGNYYEYYFPESSFTDDTWYTIALDYTQTPDDTDGTFTPANWDFFGVYWNNGSTKKATYLVWLDEVGTLDKRHRIQNNSLDEDITSANFGFQLDLRQTLGGIYTPGITDAASVKYYMDDTAGSGTTVPSDRVEHDMSGSEIYDGHTNTFKKITDQLALVGSLPDFSTIKTIGLQVTIAYHGVFEAPLDFSFHIDHYRGAKVPTGYSTDAFEMIETPGAILRYLFEDVEQTLHAASIAEAETNLGSDKLAFDLRAFGITLPEQLAGVGRNCRANFITTETATGTEVKILTAKSDYSFGDPTKLISKWKPGGCVEVGRGIEELGTRFRVVYAPNPSLGNDESIYTGLLQAHVDNNDFTVPATATLTAAEAEFGIREAAPLAFDGIQDEATAKDVAGWYLNERLRLASVYTLLGVPWHQAYDVEVGDIVAVRPPWRASAQLFSCDSDSGNWTDTNGTATDEASIKKEGAGSLKMTASGAAAAVSVARDFATARPLRYRKVSFWIYFDEDFIGNLDEVYFSVSTSGVFGTDQLRWDKSAAEVGSALGWRKLTYDLTDEPDYTVENPDPTDLDDIDAIRITAKQDSATADEIFYVDDIRVEGIKARVLETTKLTDETFDLRVVEVD